MWMKQSVFLYFFTITYVFSLNCYTVPIGTRVSEAQGILENCVKITTNIQNSSLSCYTALYTDHEQQFIGKGCITRGGCHDIDKAFQIQQKFLENINIPPSDKTHMACTECEGDACNSASKYDNHQWVILLISVFFVINNSM